MGYKQCDGLVFLVAWGGVLGGVGLVRVGVLGVSFFLAIFKFFFLPVGLSLAQLAGDFCRDVLQGGWLSLR